MLKKLLLLKHCIRVKGDLSVKVDRYKPAKSSFLSVDKDIASLSRMFMDNDRLARLLYRTGKDPMHDKNLNEEEKIELFTKQYIRTTPKISIDSESLNYLIIAFDQFTPNLTNTEFRDNVISIDILCHYDQWHIADNQLRPYRIAGEIDSMLDGARLSGIGTLQFLGGGQLLWSPEYGGLQLNYAAIHGEDDKKGFENPADEELFLEESTAMLNKFNGH